MNCNLFKIRGKAIFPVRDEHNVVQEKFAFYLSTDEPINGEHFSFCAELKKQDDVEKIYNKAIMEMSHEQTFRNMRLNFDAQKDIRQLQMDLERA